MVRRSLMQKTRVAELWLYKAHCLRRELFGATACEKIAGADLQTENLPKDSVCQCSSSGRPEELLQVPPSKAHCIFCIGTYCTLPLNLMHVPVTAVLASDSLPIAFVT